MGKVLNVIVIMRSLCIDPTIVKGHHKSIHAEDGKLATVQSQLLVFQKVTDHASMALLHSQLPQMLDVMVRSFMTWLRSYIKLFQAPCQPQRPVEGLLDPRSFRDTSSVFSLN